MNQPEYYTPSIEEFHIGFEFEALHQGGQMLAGVESTKEWIKEKCDADWFLQLLDRYEHEAEEIPNIYRVKCLDHQDIIECGWKDPTENKGRIFYHNGANLLVTYSNSRGIEITGPIGGLSKVGEESLVNNWFSGNIKNKTELKQVMKMIGIKV